MRTQLQSMFYDFEGKIKLNYRIMSILHLWNLEFLGLSIITPSGGSYRATIPVTVVRDIWNGHGKHLPVCFFREDNRVILILFDEVITGNFSG